MRHALARLGAPKNSQAAVLDPLVKTLRSNHARADIAVIERAYRTAEHYHAGQTRKSGEPYITHPVAVARILAEMHLDAETLQAAILHDTIEDTPVTKAMLVTEFGETVADLVDGVTKLDKVQFETREAATAESFRKMLLAMARDVRVILIKLADRLHNMRTMEAMTPAKRVRIAGETLEIYAPIAHRLGLNQTYRELQELSFEHLHPWRHAALSKALQRARGNRRDIVERSAELWRGLTRRNSPLPSRLRQRPAPEHRKRSTCQHGFFRDHDWRD